MKNIINLIVAFCFLNQTSFAKTELIYQTQKYRTTTALLSQDLTIDELAAKVSILVFNPKVYVEIIDYAKAAKIDPKNTRVGAVAKANKIFIDGLKDPIILANSESLEMSYKNEKINYNNSISISENLKNIEQFLKSRTGGASNVFPDSKKKSNYAAFNKLNYLNELILGKKAEANLFIPVIAAIALAAVGISLGFNHVMNIVNPETFQQEWPFDPKNIKEPVSFACSDNEFVMRQGKEEFKFRSDAYAQNNGETVPSHLVTYKDSKQYSTLKITQENKKIYFEDNVFKSNPRMTAQIKSNIATFANDSLGSDGSENPCKSGTMDPVIKEKWNQFAQNINTLKKDKAGRKQITNELLSNSPSKSK